MSTVRVIVPSWNTREHLRACLGALRRARGPALAVVVVDDGSDDGSAELVEREHPQVRLVRQARNRGFTAACNHGLEGLTEPFALLLNADAEVEPDAIAELVAYLQRSPEHGAAAPRLLSSEGCTLRTCMAFPRVRTALWFATPLERWVPDSRELRRYFLRDFDHESERDVEQPPAACLLLRREALESLRSPEGGAPLDEELRLYFSDVDLSLRLARSGWRTRYLPAARVVHHVGASTSRHPRRLLQWHLDRLTYYRKHHGRLAGSWVKACVAWSLVDFTSRQVLERLGGRPNEPVAPVLRSFGAFLVR